MRDQEILWGRRRGNERLWYRLQPLAIPQMPLDVPPPRDSRFGSPLTLSRVHWVRPELVAEVKYLTWTEDNLLRQVVYEGLREDKPAADVRRSCSAESYQALERGGL
jgi:bifunctional non-homologous end joining protein LigD